MGSTGSAMLSWHLLCCQVVLHASVDGLKQVANPAYSPTTPYTCASEICQALVLLLTCASAVVTGDLASWADTFVPFGVWHSLKAACAAAPATAC